MQSEKESYRYGLIALAVIVVILLIIIAYFVYQNRTLKKSIDEIKQSAKSRNIIRDDVSHAGQIDMNDEGNDDMNYDDVRNDEETYTALDRTGKEDEDHVYCHLNSIQQENVSEAQV